MRAFIESQDMKSPIDHDAQKAADGLKLLGARIQYFKRENTGHFYAVMDNPIFVGTITGMSAIFHEFDCRPDDIDFPESVRNAGLIYRPCVVRKLHDVIETFRRNQIGVFVKPQRTKLFDGIPVTDNSHLYYFKGLNNVWVWVSPLVEIKSEWRAYIHHGKIVQCTNYSGDFRVSPSYPYIGSLIDVYHPAPIAYTIDVAVLADGTCDVIEFNDFWAIGSYGLNCVTYAEMIRNRYYEIISQSRL